MKGEKRESVPEKETARNVEDRLQNIINALEAMSREDKDGEYSVSSAVSAVQQGREADGSKWADIATNLAKVQEWVREKAREEGE